ncbi:MAG: hypothetical protein L6R36_000708 [Xanthoria steineri]|nr:MAG: hypothetical protein L6R36_000708 [Xanthoria steineri]
MLQTKLLESITLERQPSCIAFSPVQPDIFIVGTYELYGSESDEKTTRDGSLIVFRLQRGILQHVQTLSLPFAILDVRFSPHNPHLFAFATSIGIVGMCALASESSQSTDPLSRQSPITISGEAVVVTTEEEVSITSLDFTPSDWEASVIAVTMSNGSIAVWDTATPDKISTLPAVHNLMNNPTQAWTVAWFTQKPKPGLSHFLYTGGDDSALCRHAVNDVPDVGKGFCTTASYTEFRRDVKAHDAGVTAIVPLWKDKKKREVLLTGSYDEFVRVLYITAPTKSARIEASRRLYDGVWQLKLLKRPSNPDDPAGISFLVLASCMRVGCKILKVHRNSEDEWGIEVLAEFVDPGRVRALSYASGFQVGSSSPDLQDMTFVSTSFYEKKLCIWKVEDEEAEERGRREYPILVGDSV